MITLDEALKMPAPSIRDYFAGLAMQSLINAQAELRVHTEEGIMILPARQGVPILAYQYADAMLKARES